MSAAGRGANVPPSRVSVTGQPPKVHRKRRNGGVSWDWLAANARGRPKRHALRVDNAQPPDFEGFPRWQSTLQGRGAGDDIGGQLVFNLDDFVTQLELSLLQPLHLKQI